MRLQELLVTLQWYTYALSSCHVTFIILYKSKKGVGMTLPKIRETNYCCMPPSPVLLHNYRLSLIFGTAIFTSFNI